MPDKQRVFLEGKSRVKEWRAGVLVVAVEQMAARVGSCLVIGQYRCWR